MITVNS